MGSAIRRKKAAGGKVLRFRASERRLHWAIAIPFLVCYTTALILVVVYNPDPLRPYRDVVSWTHRISGLCLIVFPLLAVFRSVGDFRVHFYNIKQAWVWIFDDLKWLSLMGLAAIFRRISLPEQGKFNAAQKLNFMMVMSTYPLYIVTGLTMWLTGAALLAWLVHFFMAVVATPFILGHIFMATIPSSTRKGLQGMFSGFVDRQWAKHHHRRWYREVFERGRNGKARANNIASPNGNSAGAVSAQVDPDPFKTARLRFAHDPEGAIMILEHLGASNPQSLHLSLLQLKNGHGPEQLRFAREALEFSARNGNWSVAADLFRALWPEVRDMRLPRAQMRGIITNLMQRQDLATASKASALLLMAGSNDQIAIQCLMKTAEDTLKHGGEPHQAKQIYDFLLKHCGQSPYAGYFHRGIEEVQNRV